jgi:hypothetical protein
MVKRERLSANDSEKQEITLLISSIKELEKMQLGKEESFASMQNELEVSLATSGSWAEKYENLSQKAQESIVALSEDCSAKSTLILSCETKISELEFNLQQKQKTVPSHGADDLKRIKELESLLRNKEFEFEQVKSDLELRAEEYMDEMTRWKEECDQLTETTTEQEYETKKKVEEIRKLKVRNGECTVERDAALSDLSVNSRQLLEKVGLNELI